MRPILVLSVVMVLLLLQANRFSCRTKDQKTQNCNRARALGFGHKMELEMDAGGAADEVRRAGVRRFCAFANL